MAKQPKETFEQRAYRETLEMLTKLSVAFKRRSELLNEDPIMLSLVAGENLEMIGTNPEVKCPGVTRRKMCLRLLGVHHEEGENQLKVPILEA